MARVKQIVNKEDVAPKDYPLFEELITRRGRVSGPSTIVLYSPGLARPWNEISEFLQGESIVEAPSAELAVCATARENDCGYIWAAHVPNARKAGVSEETIAAVRDRRALDALPPAEAAIVRYVRQLLQTNRVDSDVFDPLLKAHDARWMVELTAWIGRYSALAGIVNSFEVLAAPDADQLPVAAAATSPHKAARAVASAPRVTPITAPEQMAAADRPVFDAVAEGRGSVRGPFSMLMYSPALCQRIFDVSNCLRFESEVSPALRELATIATAREKDCAYVWAAHAPTARKEGIDDAVVTVVRDRAGLTPLSPAERDVVEYARQILRSHRVEQSLFDRLRDEHGVPWLVELTALIGHYGVITAILNAMEVAPAPDAEALPLS